MKIKIDHTIKDLTPDDIQEAMDNARSAEDYPEEVKEGLLQAKEVIFSPQVLRQLEEMGMTPDEVVAMLLKKTGASQ